MRFEPPATRYALPHTPSVCPDCGAALDLVTGGQVTEQVIPALFSGDSLAALPWVVRSVPFVACVACEYAAIVILRRS